MARNSLKSVIKLIDAANKDVSPEVDFLNNLKRSIELTEEKDTRKPSQTYKPSSMNCIRNMYYQVVGAEQDDGQASYMLTGIVNSGSDIHIRIQNAIIGMKENGIECEYIDVADFIKKRKLDHLVVKDKKQVETKIYYPDLNLSFMTDGIIKFKNHYYILEIKTESIYKWQSREGVDISHYNQATAYSVAFGLDEILFLYINRDLLDRKAFILNVTNEMKENLIGLIDECDGYVKQLKIPPKPIGVDKKTCSYCNYKNMCRKEN